MIWLKALFELKSQLHYVGIVSILANHSTFFSVKLITSTLTERLVLQFPRTSYWTCSALNCFSWVKVKGMDKKFCLTCQEWWLIAAM